MNAVAKDIYEAAVYGDIGVVKRLLKSATFADLIYKNPNDLHKTAVMVAAYHGHTEIVRAIFKHSIASVHMQDEEGWTALMYAAYRGHTSTINTILLHPEVDVNVQNNLGWTAVMLAAAQGHAASVRALLTRSNIDVNVQNKQDGGTALLLAAMKGHTEIVRDILSLKGVQVNLVDKDGRVASLAAQNDEIVSLIKFYDPEKGLVYPVPDLPPPPQHAVVLMPPMPPAHEPKLALSVEYQQCHEAVQAMLALLPSIPVRGAWHQQRLALQHQMEAAVHIHHHKEAALIGREYLAFKATTASTAELRALSEQDYLHLPEQVTLLQQRLTALCAHLTQVQDYDTLKKTEDLMIQLKEVEKALVESSATPNTKRNTQASTRVAPSSIPPPLPQPTFAAGLSITTETSVEPVHTKVHFSDPVAETGSEQEDHRESEVFMPPPPPPHNTPAHINKKNVSQSTETNVAEVHPDTFETEKKSEEETLLTSSPKLSANDNAHTSPKHTVTTTITADPELDYLPHYSAYTNTVPSGVFELPTVTKSFEELMKEKNKAKPTDTANNCVLPPPPPSDAV